MHLGGVCWAIEHGGQESGYRALQLLLEQNPWSGVAYPPEPGIPKARGSLTVASLRSLEDPESLTPASTAGPAPRGSPTQACSPSRASGCNRHWC